MSSWAESIWIIKKIKNMLPTSVPSTADIANIHGTTSTTTKLSDAIDILASLDESIFLQIDPAESSSASSTSS